MGAEAAAGERHNPRQLSAAEPLQEGAAGRGDIAEIVGHMGLVEGPDRVAATGDAHELSRLGETGNFAGERESPLAEGRRLESAKRAVPQDRLDLPQPLLEPGQALRAEIETHAIGGGFAHRANLPSRAWLELFGNDH